MKTIEERANTIADRYVDELHQKIARSSAIESATEQKLIDLESFKKWAIDNSYIPFDYYNDVKGVEEERVVSFHYLMDYLKSIEE